MIALIKTLYFFSCYRSPVDGNRRPIRSAAGTLVPMQRAAKNKTIWVVLLALASLLPPSATASSELDQGGQNRVELFLRGAQNGTGWHAFEPAKRVENYDRLRAIASGSPVAPNRGLRHAGLGDDALRNTELLTDAQRIELRTMAGQVGLGPEDLQFVNTPSAYSDLFDKVLIGPNVYPGATTSRSVVTRLTPRAVIAHERGHLLTTRAGKALEGGSLMDEVQASLVGRQLRGLSNVERYQLLRESVERARGQGQRVRNLLPELPYFRD